MRIQDANINLLQVLENLYDAREAKNIAKIFWEDLFGYRGGIDRHLHSREMKIFEKALVKLEEGQPIQYVTGVSYFYDLKLEVDEQVLIPRPETEELVYLMLSEKLPLGSRILDIGTGSGCIPIALKKKRNDFDVWALDKSVGALKVAKVNAEKNEVRVSFDHIDFLDELAWENFGLFDVIVSNPPYISVDERKHMSKSTVTYEPDLALFPESEDVLIFYKKIAKFAREHLAEGGKIYLECNEFNTHEVAEMFEHAEIVKDMQGKDRMVMVDRP